MRISTGMIYDSGVTSMQQRTASLLNTQQQLASGRRILNPSDDPVAAARALEITQAQSINAGYGAAQSDAKGSLGLVDAQLASAGDLLTRVQQLTVEAGNASLSTQDRASIATELRASYDQLIGLANSTDGTGQYLFSGYQGNSKPFSGSVANGAAYAGDNGQRSLRVSSSRDLPVSSSGNDIFMNIKNGNGVFVTSAQAQQSANASTVTVDNTSITAVPPLTPASPELRFWVDTANANGGGAGKTYYDLVDPVTGNSAYTGLPSATGAGGSYLIGSVYNSGVPINLSSASPPAAVAFNYGGQVAITGAPQTGDTFSIQVTSSAITATAKTLAVTAARANISAGSVTDPVKWSTASNSGNLEVRFWVDTANVKLGGAGQTYYDLVDANTGKSAFTGAASIPGGVGYTGHAYTSGAAISLSSPPTFDYGATVTVSGIPATGDAFTIKSSTAATGNGSFITAPKMAAAANSGTGIVGTGEVIDAAKWNSGGNSGKLEVRFWNNTTVTPAVLNYDLVDAKTGLSLFTNTASTGGGAANTFTHQYTSGNSIAFSGLAAPYNDFGASVTITGTPASGDVFSLNKSTNQSIFDTMAQAINALESPAAVGSNGNTALANQLSTVLNNLSQVQSNILRVRSDTGSSLKEIDSLDSSMQNTNLQYSASLSSLQDLDYTKAITDLTRQQTQLQAAQQSFAKIAQLSLFTYV